MIDVVVFTTAEREHLLLATCSLLKRIIAKDRHRLIIAIDGVINLAVLKMIEPDMVIMNWARRGYIHSIMNSLGVVKSNIFFWVEDDWDLSRLSESSLAQNIDFLHSNENVLQVRWSKIAPLEDAARHIERGFYESGVGFSANPCICRTSLIRAAFAHVSGSQTKGTTPGVDGFENVITAWAADRQYLCAVADPGSEPAIVHLGELESTGRQWHMTQSVDVMPSGYGYLGASPPFWRRLWMIIKLMRRFFLLSIAQLFSDAQYELAFRISVVRR